MSATGVIGISTGEQARYALFYDDLTQVKRPEGTVVIHSTAPLVNECRNKIAEEALTLGAEWVWYVDDDHAFHSDTLMRLIARDVDIVSGLYISRTSPFKPIFYEEEQDEWLVMKKGLGSQDVGLKPVLAVGAGCLLVRTRVLKEMEPPYFRFTQSERAGIIGEDINFCRRARDLGFSIYCDLDAPVGHKTTITLYPHQTSVGTWNLRMIDLGGKTIANGPMATGTV
jgi:hypothetical protein